MSLCFSDDDPVSIYGLFHKGRCVYVGWTSNDYNRSCTHKRRFTALLGEMPEWRTLHLVPKRNARSKELATIKRYRAKGEADFNILPRRKAPLSQTVSEQPATV